MLSLSMTLLPIGQEVSQLWRDLLLYKEEAYAEVRLDLEPLSVSTLVPENKQTHGFKQDKEQ